MIINCTARSACKVLVEHTNVEEGVITAFHVVAPCADVPGMVWDALDAYGLDPALPYTVGPHA